MVKIAGGDKKFGLAGEWLLHDRSYKYFRLWESSSYAEVSR